MLRAIVFDFDGVIANSEPLHFRAFRDVLAEEGVVADRGGLLRAVSRATTMSGVFEAVARRSRAPWTRGRHRRARRAQGRAAGSARTRRVDPVPRRRRGHPARAAALPLAIASGALGAEIRRVLDREQPDSAASRRSWPPKTRRPASRRPTPTCARSHCSRQRCGGTLAPADCVAIEDSPWGLESARAAGLRTVAVTQTYEASRSPAPPI